MLTEPIAAIRDILLKIPTSLLLALAIVSALVLWMPSEHAATLGIDMLRENHRPYFGFCLLLLIAMLIARFLGWSAKQHQYHKQRKVNRQYLQTLASDERGYLVPFVAEGESCLYIDATDGVAANLRRKGVLYITNRTFDVSVGIPYGIQPWALKYLKSNPKLLEGADGRPMTRRERLGFRV